MLIEDLDKYLEEADVRMKASNGHTYVTTLKTRCQHCDRSPKQKGQCSSWFGTFIDEFKSVLRENGEI